jgi:glutathione S-transferase
VLKIYGPARSRAFRVIWLCKETGIPYEHVPLTINVDDAQCKEPWYLALNPNGRVPTIDDDGLVMWESAAINLYLAEKYRSPLWPADTAGKARMLQWAFFVANDVEQPLVTVLRHRVMLPVEQRDAALADANDRLLRPKLGILDGALKAEPYFGGRAWTMADFMVASVCYTLVPTRYDLDGLPAFRAWLHASIERPMAKEARALRE